MDEKDQPTLPQNNTPRELTEEESYVKLLHLRNEIENERGSGLPDKKINAIQAILTSLMESGARIKITEQE